MVCFKEPLESKIFTVLKTTQHFWISREEPIYLLNSDDNAGADPCMRPTMWLFGADLWKGSHLLDYLPPLLFLLRVPESRRRQDWNAALVLDPNPWPQTAWSRLWLLPSVQLHTKLWLFL